MKVAHYQQAQPQVDHGLGGVVMRGLIKEEDGAPHFGMHVFELGPGAGTVFHQHWWEHEIFVLSGKGFIIAGGKKAGLQEGLVLLAPGDEPH